MPLVKTKYDVPLVAGLAEQTDPRVMREGGLLLAENVVQNRHGAIEKRASYEPLPQTTYLDTNLSATGPEPAVTQLAAREDELVAIASPVQQSENAPGFYPRLYSYVPSRQHWVMRNSVPSVKTARIHSHRSHFSHYDSHVTYTNGLYVHWYLAVDNETSVSNPLFVRATDKETGALVHLDQRVAYVAFRRTLVTVSMGIYSICMFLPAGSAYVFVVVFNTETGQTSTHTLWWGETEAYIHSFDACALANSALYVAYAMSDGLRILRYAPPPSLSPSGGGSYWNPTPDYLFGQPAICVNAAKVGVCYVATSMTTEERAIYSLLRDTNFLGSDPIAEIYTPYQPDVPTPDAWEQKLGCVLDGDNQVHVLIQDKLAEIEESYQGHGLIYIKMSPSNTVAWTVARPWIKLASRPFVGIDKQVYAIVQVGKHGHTQVLCRLPMEDRSSDVELVATAVLCRNVTRDPDVYATPSGLFRVEAVDLSGTYVFPSLSAFVVESASEAAAIVDLVGTELIYLDFVSFVPWLRSMVQVHRALLMSGGIVGYYDGDRVAEVGFLVAPELRATVVETNDPEADLPDSVQAAGEVEEGTYLYVGVFEYIDRLGTVHRSAVSEVVSATVLPHSFPANRFAVSVTARTISLSNHYDHAGPVSRVMLQVYRTLKNQPGPFYRLTHRSSSNAVEEAVECKPDVAFADFYDIKKDEGVKSNGKGYLYTDGGLLEDQQPPSSLGLLVHRSRVWLISAEDPRTIYYSKLLVPGEVPAFNEALSVRLDDAADTAVALASLDDKLIVFTPSCLYYIVGEGPDDTGANGSFSGPFLVSSNQGCADANSVIAFAGGVFFATGRGLCLLDRGLNVSFPGASVIKTITPGASFQGASHDASRSRIYWIVRQDSQSLFIVYDYLFSFWSTHTTVRPDDQTLFHTLVAGGVHYYASDAAVLRATRFGGLVGYDGATRVPSRVSTAWLRVSEIAGYQRVWRVHITAEKRTNHLLTVEIYNDFNDIAPVQSCQFDFQTGPPYEVQPEQVVVHVARQKCQAIRIVVRDDETPDNPGEAGYDPSVATGFSLAAITLELGTKQGLLKLPASMRK